MSHGQRLRGARDFQVSSSGKALTGFTYSSLGCLGAGGIAPGTNPFKFKSAIHKLGTIAVACNGTFSARTVKTNFKVAGQTITTTTTVARKCKSAKTPGGTITFGQKDTGGGVNTSCSSKPMTFSAKLVKSKSK
ncbi:MAG: hypothetical protein ACR2L9_12040 [Solirubrobacteraceae bacterium]